jgi:hypothetical protein
VFVNAVRIILGYQVLALHVPRSAIIVNLLSLWLVALLVISVWFLTLSIMASALAVIFALMMFGLWAVVIIAVIFVLMITLKIFTI